MDEEDAPKGPKKLIIKANFSKADEEEKVQFVEGDEPIRDQWIQNMRVKAIIGKFKDGSCPEQPLKKQMRIFHLEI